MQNPFESGHIKNYIMFYISVVVIMVLFFIASTLFNDVESVDRKVFKSKKAQSLQELRDSNSLEQNVTKSRFRLIDKAY